MFATGVTVVTTRVGDTIHGMTANSFTSVSLDPLLVLVCVDRRARMDALMREAGGFAVNILHEGQETISRHFAGQKKQRPPDSLHFDTEGGAPLIVGSLAALRCDIHEILDGGDHTIVLGAVTQIVRGAVGAHPLVYFGGGYRRLLVEADARAAPEPWLNRNVRLYHEEWVPIPTTSERA